MGWFSRRKWDGKIPDAWPVFVDGRKLLARWIHPDGKSRVFLVARSDGLFSKCSERFSEEEFEWCWLPDERGGGLYDTAQTAEKNIRLEYPWVAQVKKEANHTTEPLSPSRGGSS